jgi:hypothetical protein
MSYFLFLIILCTALTSSAMAQTATMSTHAFYQQRMQLHEELREAVSSGDTPKAEQLKAQLVTLHKLQLVQRHQLIAQMQAAIKSGDKQKAQQIREQLEPVNLQGYRPKMNTDPQEAALIQDLRNATINKNMRKADQVRAQLILLHKQHNAHRKQLLAEMRQAIKSGDTQKAQQLRDQLIATAP